MCCWCYLVLDFDKALGPLKNTSGPTCGQAWPLGEPGVSSLDVKVKPEPLQVKLWIHSKEEANPRFRASTRHRIIGPLCPDFKQFFMEVVWVAVSPWIQRYMQESTKAHLTLMWFQLDPTLPHLGHNVGGMEPNGSPFLNPSRSRFDLLGQHRTRNAPIPSNMTENCEIDPWILFVWLLPKSWSLVRARASRFFNVWYVLDWRLDLYCWLFVLEIVGLAFCFLLCWSECWLLGLSLLNLRHVWRNNSGGHKLLNNLFWPRLTGNATLLTARVEMHYAFLPTCCAQVSEKNWRRKLPKVSLGFLGNLGSIRAQVGPPSLRWTLQNSLWRTQGHHTFPLAESKLGHDEHPEKI